MPYDRTEEIIAFEDFVAAATPIVDEAASLSRLDWLALADRQGLPTRLLVWTSNPLAAAARALRQIPEGASVDLHAIRVPRDRRVRECDPFGEAPAGAAAVVFAGAPHRDEVLAVHGSPEQDWNPASSDLARDGLRIPAASRAFFRSRLAVFGQDGATPDHRLSVLARDLADNLGRLPPSRPS